MVKLLKIFLFLVFITSYELRVTSYELFAHDEIIAIVNNDCITQKDLNDFINFMRIQLSRDHKGKELEVRLQSMKLDLLERLIEDRLILQEAKKNNIKIDQNMVKAKLNEIKNQYDTDTEFQDELARQGLTQADIETKIGGQILAYNIIEQKVRAKIIIRPEEITNFYNKNLKDFVSSEERSLDVLILESEDLAKTFSYDLKSGKDLTDLAKKFPITLNKLRVKQNSELRKDIEDTVFKLGINEASEPIKINDKYYIFKLTNIIPSRLMALSEVQDRIHAFLLEMKMQEELIKWLDELKKQSYIKILQD